MAALMMQKAYPGDATVTVCHSRSKDLVKECQEADIIIAALGQPNFVKAGMVKEGAVVIDVGTTRVPDSTKKSGFKLTGDVKFDEVAPKCSYITPVPDVYKRQPEEARRPSSHTTDTRPLAYPCLLYTSDCRRLILIICSSLVLICILITAYSTSLLLGTIPFLYKLLSLTSKTTPLVFSAFSFLLLLLPNQLLLNSNQK